MREKPQPYQVSHFVELEGGCQNKEEAIPSSTHNKAEGQVVLINNENRIHSGTISVVSFIHPVHTKGKE